jgi:hypothetical protein
MILPGLTKLDDPFCSFSEFGDPSYTACQVREPLLHFTL